MNHKFQPKDITPGDKYTLEACIHCGVIRRRYSGTNVSFRQLDGTWSGATPNCGEIPEDLTHDHFIIAHCDHLTIDDICYELDISRDQLAKACTRLNVYPISVVAQKDQLIRDHHKNKTLAQLAKMAKCSEATVKVSLRKMGLECLADRSPARTPGQILGGYKYGTEYQTTVHELSQRCSKTLKSKEIKE